MPKTPLDLTRPARIQVAMSAEVEQALNDLSAELGLSRVLLGSIALSIGLLGVKATVKWVETYPNYYKNFVKQVPEV